MDRNMKRKPSTEATAAWIRLMRVQSRVLDAVEQDLKKALASSASTGENIGPKFLCSSVVMKLSHSSNL